MTRARALALAVIFGCLCIALASRFAEAQYSPAGGNTFGGLSGLSGGAVATGPGTGVTTLYLGDANYLDGQLPSGFQQAQTMGGCAAGTTNSAGGFVLNDASCVSGSLLPANGGTGVSVGCGSPTTTCGPCQIPGMSYWNADVGVVLGDGGAVVTWTDICGGQVVSNAVNAGQPAYTSNCLGTHHCLTFTTGTAQVLQNSTFPSPAIPFTFGAFLKTTTGAPGATDFFVDLPAAGAGAKVAVEQLTTQFLQCYAGTATVVAAGGYSNTTPGLVLCSNINAAVFNLGNCTMSSGSTACTLAAGGANVPADGGIALGGQFGSDAGAANGRLYTAYVVTHVLTPQERSSLQSWESTYWGGI